MPRKSNSRNAQGEGSIRQLENSRWEWRVTIGRNPSTGKQIQKSIYAKTQKELLEKKKQFLATLDDGIYTAPTKWTVASWLTVWVKEYTTDLRTLTIVNYAGVIKNHITPAMGGIKLADLTTPTVQAFYNELGRPTNQRDALSPATIHGIHAVLHKVLKTACELYYIRRNPASSCKLPRIPKPVIKPMDETTIAQFMEAASGDEYERVLLLDLYTGLRKSELMGLSWDCVSFEDGTIYLYRQLQTVTGGYQFGPLKNGKLRTITPPASAMRLLQEQKRVQNEMRLRAGKEWENSHGLVFTQWDGSCLCAHTVYKHYKRIVERLSLPDLRMHDLRHTYATTSLQAGNNMKEVSEALGHHSLAFTADVYLHPTERMRKESAERMEDFLNSLKKPSIKP